jgi:NADPH:quinone reductase-like Zn-dependent oxidoreductase
VLAPNATLVVVGGKRASRLLGPLGHVAGCKFGAIFASQRATFFIAKLNKADMETLRELLDAGKLTSVVDDVFPFERVADALEHMGAGHPRGKIVVTVAGA